MMLTTTGSTDMTPELGDRMVAIATVIIAVLWACGLFDPPAPDNLTAALVAVHQGDLP